MNKSIIIVRQWHDDYIKENCLSRHSIEDVEYSIEYILSRIKQGELKEEMEGIKKELEKTIDHKYVHKNIA